MQLVHLEVGKGPCSLLCALAEAASHKQRLVFFVSGPLFQSSWALEVPDWHRMGAEGLVSGLCAHAGALTAQSLGMGRWGMRSLPEALA